MKVENNIIIDENKLYRDIETGEILTELELYMYYLDTDQEHSFWGYLRNCTDKNGTLEEITDNKKYIYSEETEIILTKRQWFDFYNHNIDRNEYNTFWYWWIDMINMNLIREV